MGKVTFTDVDTGAFSSFSGADAIVTFEGAHIANLQAINVSTTRETVPLYILGSANPISFNKNKRAIAGSMVFLNFDRDMLIETLRDKALNVNYRSKIRNGLLMPAGNTAKGYTERDGGQEYIQAISGMDANQLGAFFKLKSSVQEFQALVQNQILNDPLSRGFRRVPITYEDQLPQFDVALYFANADGKTAHMAIRGCTILNSGFGISIDDAVSEKAVTFVARRIEPLSAGLTDSGTATTADPIPDNIQQDLYADVLGGTESSIAAYYNTLQSSITSTTRTSANSAGQETLYVIS